MVCQIFMEKATKADGSGEEIQDLLYSWTAEFNILKTAIFPKFTYKFNTISIKNSCTVFQRTWQNYAKEKGRGLDRDGSNLNNVMLPQGAGTRNRST